MIKFIAFVLSCFVFFSSPHCYAEKALKESALEGRSIMTVDKSGHELFRDSLGVGVEEVGAVSTSCAALIKFIIGLEKTDKPEELPIFKMGVSLAQFSHKLYGKDINAKKKVNAEISEHLSMINDDAMQIVDDPDSKNNMDKFMRLLDGGFKRCKSFYGKLQSNFGIE